MRKDIETALYNNVIKENEKGPNVHPCPYMKYIISCWEGAFNDGPVNGIEKEKYISKNASKIEAIKKLLRESGKSMLMIHEYETHFYDDKGIIFVVKIKFENEARNKLLYIDCPLPQYFEVGDTIHKSEYIDLLQFLPKEDLKEAVSVEVKNVYMYGCFDISKETIGERDTFDKNTINE